MDLKLIVDSCGMFPGNVFAAASLGEIFNLFFLCQKKVQLLNKAIDANPLQCTKSASIINVAEFNVTDFVR